jgi:demethylmenaquinone methyltransferase/2-methoxy-6-polyprenyl-1,4-benzoquinol methylase
MSDDPLRSYYRARAPEYDRIYAKPERQADLRDIERRVAALLAGRRVLEVACGTGYWTQFIAPAARGVFAIDQSPETMRIAAARPGVANVGFIEGDAYALPPPPEPCDAAFAGFWISHVPWARMREFFAGLHARLVPGALVVLLDNRYVPGSSTPISETYAEGNTYQARPLDDGTTHRVLKNFPTRERLCGLVGVDPRQARWHEWPYYWALEYTAPR